MNNIDELNMHSELLLCHLDSNLRKNESAYKMALINIESDYLGCY